MRPDVSLVTTGHDVAAARGHRLVGALQDRGMTVEVLGVGRAQDAPPGTRVRTWQRGGMAARGLRALVLPWRASGRVLLCQDPDVLPAAAAVRLVRRRPLVADVHEDYAALLQDRAWARGWRKTAARGVVAMATALARHADLTVVADEHVPPRAARRRLVVRNVADTSLLPPARPADPTPRALYVGDVRVSRGAIDMLDAVAQAPGWSLDIVGPVAPADASLIEERVLRPDVAGRVRLHGLQPPRQAWEIGAGAWVGLCLLQDTPAFVDAVPSKVYEYLAAGLAVVCTDLPRQRKLVEESGAGIVVPTGQPCAARAGAALRELSGNPQTLQRMRSAGPRWTADTRAVEDPYRAFALAVAELSELSTGSPAHG